MDGWLGFNGILSTQVAAVNARVHGDINLTFNGSNIL